jgi:hypothetical protein
MAPFQQKRMLANWTPDPKHPGGRPSEYKPEYCDIVRERMAEGLSLTACAHFMGVSREAIYSWMTAHREFADAVSRARPSRQAWLELKLLHSRRGGEVAAAVFALKNAAPEDWRDMKTVEHNHLHAVAQLTDAQLHAIAAGAAADVGDGVTIDGEAQHLNER